jgi:glycosyltransferase involved in cell wall biosynthesis
MVANLKQRTANNNKLMLISFNTKEGMKLIADSYIGNFASLAKVTAITDRDYQPEIVNSSTTDIKFDLFRLSSSKKHLSMAMDVFNPILIFKVLSIYIRVKPEACYFISAHPLNPVALVLFRLFAKFSNPQVKLFSHIHDVKPHAATKNYALIDLFQSWQIARSDLLVVYGHTLKQMLMTRFKIKPERVLVSWHGVNRVNDSKYHQNSSNSLKYITLSGRLDKYKGIDLFLDAARYFQEHHADIRFVLAGRGDLSEYQDRIDSLTNLTIVNRFLSNDEVDELMIQSFAVLLPYIDASQSGVIPIAYYNGCPVIVSDVGGLREAVIEGETGYVFERGNLSQAIERIEAVVKNHELRDTLGKNCFEHYQSNLRWDAIIANLTDKMLS